MDKLGRGSIPSFSTLEYPLLTLTARKKVRNALRRCSICVLKSICVHYVLQLCHFIIRAGLSSFHPIEEAVLTGIICNTSGFDLSNLKVRSMMTSNDAVLAVMFTNSVHRPT